MKKKVLAVVIGLVVASSMVCAQTSQTNQTIKFSKADQVSLAKAIQAEALNAKWEYKYITLQNLLNVSSAADLPISDETLNASTEKALCELGRERWELIHVGDQGYIFKRPVK